MRIPNFFIIQPINPVSNCQRLEHTPNFQKIIANLLQLFTYLDFENLTHQSLFYHNLIKLIYHKTNSPLLKDIYLNFFHLPSISPSKYAINNSLPRFKESEINLFTIYKFYLMFVSKLYPSNPGQNSYCIARTRNTPFSVTIFYKKDSTTI